MFTADAAGKLDLFPLDAGAIRAQGPDDSLAIEEPGRLLLNPCLDNPEKHLRYDKEGNVLPRTLSGKPSPKATESIKAYVLWRHPLVEDRHETYLDMKKIWANTLDGAQMIDTLPSPQKALIARFILRNESDLLAFSESKKRSTGMARWLSRSYIRELHEIKQRLQSCFGQSIEDAAA